jgi:excisionase family DNA binding protein
MAAALAYTIREACDASDIGRSSLYEHLKSGALLPGKHGKRTLILRADLLAWLEALPRLSR